MLTEVDTKQVLFEENVRLVGVTEFGVSWDELVKGEAILPPSGARFDIAFEAELKGKRINGTLKGIDFLTVRADYRFDMSIHATITTDDGVKIAFEENGVLTPREDGSAELRLNMRFTTAHEKYAWLNKIQGWGLGTIDRSSGQGRVTAFAA
jgi:hypothetical protein